MNCDRMKSSSALVNSIGVRKSSAVPIRKMPLHASFRDGTAACVRVATVASAAPTVGFLGTVAGMVESFNDIVERLGTENIVKSASAGISVALLTTALGLIVGLPAYVAYNYFSGVVNEFVLEVEESATELVESITLQMALERAEAATV